MPKEKIEQFADRVAELGERVEEQEKKSAAVLKKAAAAIERSRKARGDFGAVEQRVKRAGAS